MWTLEKNKSSENKNKAASLIDLFPESVVIVDPQGKIVAANKVVGKYTGYKSEDLIGKNLFEQRFFEEETKAILQENMKKRLKGSPIPSYEIKIKAKNGEFQFLEIKGNKIEYEGQICDLIIFYDVTDRSNNQKKLQQELLESEERSCGITNSIRDAVILVNNEAKVVYWNPAAEKTFGYTTKEATGKYVHELVIPKTMCNEGKGRIDTCVKVFGQTGMGYFTVGNVEVLGRRKDGSEFPAELAMSSLRLGGKWHAVGVVQDITLRKREEQKLREAEQRYHALFNQAPLGISILDPETTAFVEFNDVAHLQLGYTREEFEKLTIYDITGEENKSIIKSRMDEILRTGAGEFETKHRAKNGNIKNVLVSALTLQLAGKTFVHAVFHDVTETRKVQNDLRASEERFRAISTSAMDAIILVDATDTVIYWNPAAEKTFGYSEKEALGRQLAGLIIPSQECAKHQAILQEIIQKPSFEKHYEFMAVKKDRTILSIEVSVTSLMLNDRSCMLAIARDVSDRRTMEDALKQERDMLENMAASIDAGLTLISRDYRILWANQLLKQVTGNKLENEHCYSIYDQSDRICPDCGVRKVFENGVAVDRHDYHLKVPGRDEWVELIVTPVKDKDGKVVAALELAVNITERKHLQNKLAEYSQRLEELVLQRTEQLKTAQAELVKSERLAAIGELAGMVGHDLRNPLSGIKNSAYFLKKKGTDISPPQAREMLDIIDKCVDYSNKIVNDLLDYSRDIHLELQECSPRQIILESLDMIQVPENVKIENNLLHKQTLKADTDKIKRVFTNLIKNAIDAMPDGGKLTIGGKVKGNYEISFEDTGTGIKEEVLQKLFTPLFTTKAKGMGFGLAICKRIVEAHGGSITVKTVKNKGTTFTIALPIEPKLEVGGEKIWVNMPQFSLSMTAKT